MPIGSPAAVLYRYQGQALAALPANANETTLINTPALQAALPGAFGEPVAGPQPVKISGVINITAGTGVTAIVVKVHQGVAGSLGAIVGGTATVTLAAGNSVSIPFSVEDNTGLVQSPAGTPYAVTVTQTGATAASTVNTFDLEVSA